MDHRIVRAALAVALLAFTGCGLAFYRGPAGMEGAIERQLDCELNRDFGLKLGFLMAPLASSIVRKTADTGDEEFLKGLHIRKVGVAVFHVENQGNDVRRLDPGKLGLSGWDTLARVKQDGEQLLVMSKPEKSGSIRNVVLVTYNGDEVTIVRIKGDLDKLVQAAAEAAAREGKSS
ncbi:MAG TPA: DUF4252 domain-containing protein [Candidatus Polarisedimenticolaceae bacterium]|nr:DUF4252 domain-containing protein [Candidatus Polarisedimenticolaceae bacterium]